MSAHDRAAIRHAQRFTLTVTRYLSHSCMQEAEFPHLTMDQVEERKKLEREMHPESQEWGTGVAFDVSYG